jgi:hypothetical protein
MQLLCHVDAVVALLADSMRLDEADAVIEGDVLGHQRVRIQVDCVIAASAGLRFGEFDQCAAMALALTARRDRDVIEQETRLRFLQHEDADDASTVLHHPGLAVSDAPRVIVQHRAGQFADASGVVRIRGMDDVAHDGSIMMTGSADHGGSRATRQSSRPLSHCLSRGLQPHRLRQPIQPTHNAFAGEHAAVFLKPKDQPTARKPQPGPRQQIQRAGR